MANQQFAFLVVEVHAVALFGKNPIRFFSHCKVRLADKEAGFFILNRTKCAAALTENGFQNTRESLRFLQRPEGRKAIVNLHVAGIIEFLKSL